MNPSPERLLAASALTFTLLCTSATGDEGKPSISEIFKGPLATNDALELIVSEVSYPPGFVSPRHHHTGHVLVYVLDGEGAMEVDGAVRTGAPGAVIEEHPERVMTMSNTSETDWLRFVVFQVGPTGAPMIVRTE